MKQALIHGLRAAVPVLLLTAFTIGCSTAPLRTETTTSGISTAEAMGAEDVPRASLLLQLAREELERARVLSADNKEDEAESMLMRAEVDAELAALLAMQDTEREEAKAAIERVRQLRLRN
jgi:cation transport ATPase